MTTPLSAYHVLAHFLTEVRAALVEAGRPAVTTSYVGAGVIAWDDRCGQLVVSPGRIYRYTSFPSEDTSIEACWHGDIAIPVQVLLTRCVPGPDDMLNPPPDTDLDAAHRVILDDGAVIWNAVNGPLPDDEWERAAMSQSYLGSEGGAVAVLTSFTIGVDGQNWCGP